MLLNIYNKVIFDAIAGCLSAIVIWALKESFCFHNNCFPICTSEIPIQDGIVDNFYTVLKCVKVTLKKRVSRFVGYNLVFLLTLKCWKSKTFDWSVLWIASFKLIVLCSRFVFTQIVVIRVLSVCFLLIRNGFIYHTYHTKLELASMFASQNMEWNSDHSVIFLRIGESLALMFISRL